MNAGHNPQFALGVDGTVTRLESTGRPLGLLPGAGYQNSHLQLKDGDCLFFYTDGLVEAENAEGQEFGTERLEKLVLQERSAGLEGMLARVEQLTKDYRGTLEAADDATMVLVKIGVQELGVAPR